MGSVNSQALLIIFATDDRCSHGGLHGVNIARKLSSLTREITLAAQHVFESYLDMGYMSPWKIRNTGRYQHGYGIRPRLFCICV